MTNELQKLLLKTSAGNDDYFYAILKEDWYTAALYATKKAIQMVCTNDAPEELVYYLLTRNRLVTDKQAEILFRKITKYDASLFRFAPDIVFPYIKTAYDAVQALCQNAGSTEQRWQLVKMLAGSVDIWRVVDHVTPEQLDYLVASVKDATAAYHLVYANMSENHLTYLLGLTDYPAEVLEYHTKLTPDQVQLLVGRLSTDQERYGVLDYRPELANQLIPQITDPDYIELAILDYYPDSPEAESRRPQKDQPAKYRPSTLRVLVRRQSTRIPPRKPIGGPIPLTMAQRVALDN